MDFFNGLLDYAHRNGVIHRDIKPANLLLDKEGTVKILDMGLARIDSDSNAPTQGELTGTGTVMGTIDYMSPEQARNTHHADARADIYSLGCSLFYMLTARPIFNADTITNKLIAHQFDPIPKLDEMRGDVLPDLEAVYERMVTKKVEDRYQTMAELIEDLQATVAASAAGTDSNSNIAFLKEAYDTFHRTAHTIHQTSQTLHRIKTAGQGQKGGGKAKLALVGAGIFGVILAVAALAASLKTKDGTLVVEVDQTDAIVQVLDSEGKIEVSRKGTDGKVVLSVDSGQHRLRVEKEGFTAYGKDFEIIASGNLTIRARLIPLSKPVIPDGFDLSDKLASVPQPSKPTANTLPDINAPEFQAWMKQVQAMSVDEQVKAVSKKLVELNPGFDGRVKHKSENGIVIELVIQSNKLTDISPVLAFSDLKTLDCFKTQIESLSFLQSLKLTTLNCGDTKVSDLSPLQSMNLTTLCCRNTRVSDLSPLTGMMLTSLDCDITPVSSLLPLKGMNLTRLSCGLTKITDISVLEGMKLTSLNCGFTRVADLSPLYHCESLVDLHVPKTKVTPDSVAALQKALPNCKIEWDDPAKAAKP